MDWARLIKTTCSTFFLFDFYFSIWHLLISTLIPFSSLWEQTHTACNSDSAFIEMPPKGSLWKLCVFQLEARLNASPFLCFSHPIRDSTTVITDTEGKYALSCWAAWTSVTGKYRSLVYRLSCLYLGTIWRALCLEVTQPRFSFIFLLWNKSGSPFYLSCPFLIWKKPFLFFFQISKSAPFWGFVLFNFNFFTYIFFCP